MYTKKNKITKKKVGAGFLGNFFKKKPQAPKSPKEQQGSKSPKSPKSPKSSKEPQAPKEPGAPQEPGAPKAPQEQQAPKEPQEPGAPKAPNNHMSLKNTRLNKPMINNAKKTHKVSIIDKVLNKIFFKICKRKQDAIEEKKADKTDLLAKVCKLAIPNEFSPHPSLPKLVKAPSLEEYEQETKF